jgi:hypothetical protein
MTHRPTPPADIREDKYDQAIADELREVAASIGGGDSISGLMILGLVDEYEMAPGGPRAQLRRHDTREEFPKIAESRRKPPISASNIGYNCAIDEMIADLRALPSVCGGEVPEGWQLVPKEPTEAMWDAGCAAYEKELLKNRNRVGEATRAKWSAMLAASPSPPPVSAKCTCHPDDNPPRPCPQKFALSECRRAESIRNAIAAMEPFAAYAGNTTTISSLPARAAEAMNGSIGMPANVDCHNLAQIMLEAALASAPQPGPTMEATDNERIAELERSLSGAREESKFCRERLVALASTFEQIARHALDRETQINANAAPQPACVAWKLVPREPLPQQLEGAAHNLSDEYGPDFVRPLGKFAADLYREMVGLSPAPSPGGALDDIYAERTRQIEQEGWTSAHDDKHHRDGGLAAAAATYAYAASIGDSLPKSYGGRLPFTSRPGLISILRFIWPWAQEWWKPGDTRRNLVKAGALIVAEIERLDRLSARREG